MKKAPVIDGDFAEVETALDLQISKKLSFSVFN